MKTQINISGLLEKFELISEAECRSILGGTDLEAVYAQLFDFSASNLTPAVIAMFKKQIEDLASTTVGSNLLDGLLAAGHKIYVTNDVPPGGKASAAYEGTENKILLGALDADMSTAYNRAFAFSILSHEMYHAYQDLVLDKNATSAAYRANANDVKGELDAGIFSYMACVQYDINHNLNRDHSESHARMSFSLPGSYSTTAGETFNAVWDDMFQNGKFTLENYNKLIDAWKDGGSSYNSPVGTFNHLDSFENTWIDNIFNTGYSGDAKLFKAMYENYDKTPNELILLDPTLHGSINQPTGSGSGSQGGSSGPSYNNDPSNPGSDSGYTPGTNTGNGSFYYGYPDGGSGGGGDTAWWQLFMFHSNGGGASWSDSSSY